MDEKLKRLRRLTEAIGDSQLREELLAVCERMEENVKLVGLIKSANKKKHRHELLEGIALCFSEQWWAAENTGERPPREYRRQACDAAYTPREIPEFDRQWDFYFCRLIDKVMELDSEYFRELADAIDYAKAGREDGVLENTITRMLIRHRGEPISVESVRFALPAWARREIRSDNTIRRAIRRLGGHVLDCRGRPMEK